MSNRIAIIGAGIAGLAAAHKLYANGFNDVIVLEATDRIGGRIHTIPFGIQIMNRIITLTLIYNFLCNLIRERSSRTGSPMVARRTGKPTLPYGQRARPSIKPRIRFWC